MSQHKCSPCQDVFETEQEYLDHTCKVSKAKPTEVEHLKKTTTPNFDAISEAAKKRTNK